MELEPFQRVMLGDFFAGATETVILVSKKNGKSTILGALALHHLLTTPDAECAIVAASREQAEIMLRQAQGFIRRSPGLQRRMRVKQREILSLRDSGRIQVRASDVDTLDGWLGTLALVDELHRHKSTELYGVMHDGLGPRQGRMLTISTAGDDESSPLGMLRQRAYALSVKRDARYTYARSPDRSFALHEWALRPEDDREDMAVVKLANPASWHTTEALQKRFASPSMTPWRWARFACGLWGIGSEPAFDAELWAQLEQEASIEPGRMVVLGFDGARRRDATVLVATDIETGHQIVVGAWERPLHALDDWEIPEAEVDEAVAYAFGRWEVWRMHADPPYWETPIDRWAGEYGKDRVVRWYTQHLKQTALALRAWQNDMRPGAMSHDGDELLARHIANAVRRNTRMRDDKDELLWTISKDSPKSERKIDGAMAACLAWEARRLALQAGVLSRPKYAAASW